ncbi:Eukaryotic translation initiation factor 4B [Melipona quadrifasciata]|uniref:Eukaryotic translation initiation factor 4B n=1 Tax=Melipona quadrifasciata TaxID=166423 RepID=A0A0M8ZRL0_9HYME|nr:Eukaryotic translation initiation factor 4B [Melipona quadrifasciata]
MSSGKKGKKKKCKTVDLMSFLADGGGTPTVPVKPLTSWIDEMEEEHEGFSSRSSKEPVILPTAPRAARGPRVADEDIPSNPPYVAYLSNLPYEVDEVYLTEFFSNMKISNIRLPKDSNKLKGYGYVEFEDRQSLIDALCLSNTPMKTRRVRIDISNSVNDDRRGGRMSRDNRRDNDYDSERTSGDWRSGPRDENLTSDGDSYRSRYDNRDRRDDRESSDYDNKPGAWRENSDRARPTFRDRGGFKDDEKDREWSRYDRGSRDRDGDKGSSFGPRRNYGDSDWDRDGLRRQGKPPIDNKSELRTRPKLQLQPRTKPIDPIVIDCSFREKERSSKEGTWGKRNGEGREERERGRQTWRSEDDRGRRNERSAPRSQPAYPDQYAESKGQPVSRGGRPSSRGPPKSNDTRGGDRDRKDREKDVSRMPKAKDEQAPNFVASNKYSMLPDDVDPDNIDD